MASISNYKWLMFTLLDISVLQALDSTTRREKNWCHGRQHLSVTYDMRLVLTTRELMIDGCVEESDTCNQGNEQDPPRWDLKHSVM